MATEKPHVYRVPRTHPQAGRMKPGQVMAVKMRMLEPDADDQTYPMEETSSEVQPEPKPAASRRSPIQYLKDKRRRKR